MGRISDGTFNFYGKKLGQYDITKDANWITRANQEASFAMGITQTATNSIFGFCLWAADPERGGGGGSSTVNPNNDGKLGATGEEIKAEIEQTLKGVGYNDIASLNAGIESQKITIAQFNKKVTECDDKIRSSNSTIQNLEASQQYYQGILSDTNNPKYNEAQKKLPTIKAKLDKAREEKEEAEIDKNEYTNNLKILNGDLAKLNAAKANIDQLQAALIKAEKRDGKDVIENMTNQDTKEFTTLLGDLRKAITTGDQNKIDKAALALNTQYENYLKKVGGDQNKLPTHINSGYAAAKRYIPKA
ncbi:MAG: hypothetical protein E7Z92_05760 [Cyanobacteria bacterium SIG31]|nr:hypothetical protein [Cyanobacteria bacterium SIG31]